MHEKDALEVAATPHRLAVLGQGGVLDEGAKQRAFELTAGTPPVEVWQRMLSRLLLVLGAMLSVAGVVFFFAFNWAKLPAWGKLGLLEASVALTALAALRPSNSLVVRQVLLLAAAVLVGPLLGVFGQTYQTGADPWGLFALWAALALPWALVARAPALWLLEVVLVDTAIALLYVQVVGGEAHEIRGALVTACVNAAAWAIWEVLAARGAPGVRGRWWPRLMASSVLGMLLLPSVIAVVEKPRGPSGLGLAAEVLAIVTSVVVFRRRDLFVVAAAMGTAMIVFDVMVGRGLFQGSRDIAGATLIMGILVAVEVALAVNVLRRLGASQEVE